MNRWEVSAKHSGVSLQVFLKEMLGEGVSGKQIKRLIDAGKCMLNRKSERFASRLVGPGDKVELDISKPAEKVRQSNIADSTRILYSDEDIIAYNKPAGVASDSSGILDGLKKRFGACILLHRLDKETTGILLFARNEPVAAAIEKLFKQRLVKKTYLAFVKGIPSKTSGMIENSLGKLHVFHGQTVWGVVPREKGLLAKTSWEVKEKGKGSALLICRPETGRTHQIRVHLSNLGFPILGDHQYGSSFAGEYRPQRIMLHASEISFEHPKTKQPLNISSPLPDDFKEAMKLLLVSHG
ncbi:MAG TPA: RluA family pseudouridine synthase [Parachlamydiaceae bacterium]|nr:RluA family pseudouridine synthase [Parachlamydiaceae bacterium]